MERQKPQLPPSRARASKHLSILARLLDLLAAPFAGAWMETSELLGTGSCQSVAPFAWAWIEMNRWV